MVATPFPIPSSTRGAKLFFQRLAWSINRWGYVFLYCDRLLAIKNQNLKVLGSYKNSTRSAFPVQVFAKAWEVVMETAGLGSWSTYVQMYIFSYRHRGFFNVIKTRVSGFLPTSQQYRYIDGDCPKHSFANFRAALCSRRNDMDAALRRLSAFMMKQIKIPSLPMGRCSIYCKTL